MTSIEERLTRIEAHLFGKAEQPPTKERTFESFYVDCTKEQYPEVKRILEAQGYELHGKEWLDEEDYVTTTKTGLYMTYNSTGKPSFEREPVYTLPQLREKFGVEKTQEQLRDFVVPLAHATLTRDEVAARCIAAAEMKGYKADEDLEYSDFRIYANKNCRQPRYFITNSERDGYGFRFQNTLKNHDQHTLEAFEEYCGVEQPPKPKTRIEWLNELPDGYRERAVANCKEWTDGKPTDVCLSIQEAIQGMCDWSYTPEDWEFWLDVYNYYEEGNVLPSLPTGNSEKPNGHDATEKSVYEAGFWFAGERQFLKLPDETEFYLALEGSWRKDESVDETDHHTLTPVETHTVGKFYALAGIEPNHLNDWRSYALCVKNEDVPYFVRPTSEYGIVSIDRIRPSHVSLNEVTPV